MARFDLVFEGGGAKGIVFVGALQAFEQARHNCDRVIGTSAGAITATLLAAGYDSREISLALAEESEDGGRSVFAGFLALPPTCGPKPARGSATVELLQWLERAYLPQWLEGRLTAWLARKLLTSKRTLPRHLCSLLENGGLYSADSFCSWMKTRLDTGSFRGRDRCFGSHTLRDFYEATQTELCLVASDTTDREMLVLNHRTAPDCPVVSAVRMSMSIPLLWQEVRWNGTEWGKYLDKNISGHVVVDGGILSNFPLELVVSDLPAITRTMGARRAKNFLGLLIDETLPVGGSEPQAGSPAGAAPEPEAGWRALRSVDRLARLIDTMTSVRTKQLVDAFEAFVVRLPAQGYATTEFEMSPARMTALHNAGHRAMSEYLESNQALVEGGTKSPEYRRAAELANRLARRHVSLGRQALQRREWEGALGHFRKAIEADPSSPDALSHLASLQQLLAKHALERGDSAEVRRRLEEVRDRLSDIDARTPGILVLRGYLKQTLAQLSDIEGDPRGQQASLDEAARLFAEVLELGDVKPHHYGYLRTGWKGPLAVNVRNRLAADFRNWERDAAKFDEGFAKVLEALRPEPH